MDLNQDFENEDKVMNPPLSEFAKNIISHLDQEGTEEIPGTFGFNRMNTYGTLVAQGTYLWNPKTSCVSRF